MSKPPAHTPGEKPKQKREVFDERGCAVCGTHISSSFRKAENGDGRLCNSCHCKAYRQKRKGAGLPTSAARGCGRGRRARAHTSDDSPPTTPSSTQPSLEAGSPWMFTPGGQHAASTQFEGASAAVTPHAVIGDLQRCVFERTGCSPTDVVVRLHCAGRAQQATPHSAHRVVLGVLPSLQLQLPDDPPGLLHAVSCLVEAVAHADTHKEEGADSEPGPEPEQDRAVEPVAVRLTVFAAAGAVACWHEAPADPALPLAFSPLTKAPVWTSGPGGFSLYFPHPFCPQIDLFAALHQFVAAVGQAALCHPLLSLEASKAWNFEAELIARHSSFAQQSSLLQAYGGGGADAAQLLLMGQASGPLAAALPAMIAAMVPSGANPAGTAATAQPLRRQAPPQPLPVPLESGSQGAAASLSLPQPSFVPPAFPQDDVPSLPGLSCFLDHNLLG